MPVYRFDMVTRDGRRLADEVGTMLPDDVAAEREALASIVDLTKRSAKSWLGCRFEVAGPNGQVIEVEFDDVLSAAVARLPVSDGGRTTLR